MVLTKALAVPFDWGLRRRARHQTARQSAGLTGGVGRAVIRQPFNHSIGLGNLSTRPKRRSTLSIIRSRMSELLRPPVVATQEIASRSEQSRVKAIRTFWPLSQPICIGAINRDAAIVPPFLAASGMALEQQAVRLHDPVDPLHVHYRAALLITLTPQQRMGTAVAVGRLAGDQQLDLGDELRLGLRSPTATLRGPLRCRLLSKVGAGHTEGIGDRLHGMSSRALSMAPELVGVGQLAMRRVLKV
jgi:hypothetical protein